MEINPSSVLEHLRILNVEENNEIQKIGVIKSMMPHKEKFPPGGLLIVHTKSLYVHEPKLGTDIT